MAEMDTGGDGGGGDGDGVNDTGNDTTTATGGGGVVSLSDLVPAWFVENLDTLKKFLTNPVGFLLGAVLVTVLNTVEAVTVAILDAILAVYDAIAVIPQTGASVLLGAGSVLGDAIFMAVIDFNNSLIAAAASAGLAAPVIGTVVVVAEGIALLWALEKLVRIVLDVIPGGGAILP